MARIRFCATPASAVVLVIVYFCLVEAFESVIAKDSRSADIEALLDIQKRLALRGCNWWECGAVVASCTAACLTGVASCLGCMGGLYASCCSCVNACGGTSLVNLEQPLVSNSEIPIFHGPSNTADGKRLCFDNADREMAWPMTSPQNIHNLISHGPHCVSILQKPVKSEMDRLHHHHCHVVVLRSLNFSLENPEYRVPKVLCDDIKQMHQGHSPADFAFNYGIAYPLEATHQEPIVEEGSDITLIYPSSYSNTSNEKYEKIKSMSHNEDELFSLLSGQNFGDLLMKQWANSTLTKTEKATLQEWLSEPAIRFAALGIDCFYGDGTAPTAFLIKLLVNE